MKEPPGPGLVITTAESPLAPLSGSCELPSCWAPPRPPGASAGEGAARLCARAEVGSPFTLTLHTKTGSSGRWRGSPRGHCADPGPADPRREGPPDFPSPRPARRPARALGRGSLSVREDGAQGEGARAAPSLRVGPRRPGSQGGRGGRGAWPPAGRVLSTRGAVSEGSPGGRSALLIVASSA